MLNLLRLAPPSLVSDGPKTLVLLLTLLRQQCIPNKVLESSGVLS